MVYIINVSPNYCLSLAIEFNSDTCRVHKYQNAHVYVHVCICVSSCLGWRYMYIISYCHTKHIILRIFNITVS